MQEHHASASASAANVVCPNVLELGVMTRTEPRDPAQVLRAARQLLDKGPRLVLVKHLAHAGLDPDRSFEMLLVSAAPRGTWRRRCSPSRDRPSAWAT